MKIHNNIGCRQKVAGEIVRDLFRDGAIRATGETAVEIALVDGGCSRPRQKGWIVHCRHNDNTPTDLLRFEIGGEIVECDGTFVFIAVIGSRQESRWTVAIPDHADR